MTWTSPVDFGSISSLRMYVIKSGPDAGFLRVNGTNYDSLVPDGDAWVTIPESSLSTIQIGYTNGLTTGTGIAGVEVDGSLLVDGGSFGKNGFYLPFAEAEGIGTDASGQDNDFQDENFSFETVLKTYNNTATLTGSSGVPNVFDGNLGTGVRGPGVMNGTSLFTLNFNGLLDGVTVTSLRCAFQTSGDYQGPNGDGLRFKVNEGAYQEVGLGVGVSPAQWFTYNSPPTSIDTITCSSSIQTGKATGIGLILCAVEVNGEVLISGEVQTRDPVYDTPMRSAAVLDLSTGNGLGTVTNGNLVYTQTASGNETVKATLQLANGAYYWEVVQGSDTNTTPGISPLSTSTYPGAEAGFGWELQTGWINLNGVRSEAFETATPGDVVGFTFNTSTYQLNAFLNGTRTAWSPVTVTADVDYFPGIASTTSGGAAGTVNFGQQPFAASNVTYDIEAGTVMLNVTPNPDPNVDNSQSWSAGVQTGTLRADSASWADAFSGETTNVVAPADNASATLTFATPIPVVGTVKCDFLSGTPGDGGNGYFYINGEFIASNDGLLDITARLAELNISQIESLKVESLQVGRFGQFRSLYVDNKLLVDGTDPGPYSTLFQTWEQYAHAPLGYALDRIVKLEKLRLEDAKTIANLRTMIDGALSRIASIESDEVNDDAVDTSLITLVGSLSSQITTWTQRIEQAETALSDVVNRVTTLEL